MSNDTATFVEPSIVHGDARQLSLPDGSVDLVVTSPPYFGLRSYQDGHNSYRGQLGAEGTPGEYLDNLITCTREMIRVLKPSGSLFINLGDKYSGAGRGNNVSAQLTNPPDVQRSRLRASNRRQHLGTETAPAKSLLGLPWRYALRCIDELGLILRAEIIWNKPAGMPESVRDRVRRSHETWFHFTLDQHYYSALDNLRQPHATSERRGYRASYRPGSTSSYERARGHETKTGNFAGLPLHPHGRLPGSVWDIPPQPLRVPPELDITHYASFPVEWPRRLIIGWSPHKVCTACGQGRRRTPVAYGLDTSRPQTRRALELAREHGLTEDHLTALRSAGLSDTRRATDTQGRPPHRDHPAGRLVAEARAALGGYAREFLLSRATDFADTCGCADTHAPTVPGVVLDPCGGTGTTALAAAVLGRRGISIDASRDYCRLAAWRTHDPRQQSRARDATPSSAQLTPTPQATATNDRASTAAERDTDRSGGRVAEGPRAA